MPGLTQNPSPGDWFGSRNSLKSASDRMTKAQSITNICIHTLSSITSFIANVLAQFHESLA